MYRMMQPDDERATIFDEETNIRFKCIIIFLWIIYVVHACLSISLHNVYPRIFCVYLCIRMYIYGICRYVQTIRICTYVCTFYFLEYNDGSSTIESDQRFPTSCISLDLHPILYLFPDVSLSTYISRRGVPLSDKMTFTSNIDNVFLSTTGPIE